MADKELFWHKHENIPPNVIGMFENDLMYGSVVYVPRPSSNKFDYTIEWDMPRLSDVFPIAWYPICTNVSSTYALKLNLQLAINRSNTGNYTFIEPRSQIVQTQGQVAAPTPCICSSP